MRGWVLIALGASCTARPFVDVDDAGETSGVADPESSGGAGSEGIVSSSASASVDGGDDDDLPATTSGPEPDCAEPVAPPITVDVYPGEDPLEGENGTVRNEWDCEIQKRTEDKGGVWLGLDCGIEPPWLTTVLLTIDAQGITVPADLDSPAQVHLRVETYRDAELIEEFPWMRMDYFAMYQGDELVLGAGAGRSMPVTDTGADFWAPVYIEGSWSSCDAVVSECHEVTPGSLLVIRGDEKIQAPAYSLVSIGGYDVHVGEMAGSDSPKCGEPSYNWSSFAIAPTP